MSKGHVSTRQQAVVPGSRGRRSRAVPLGLRQLLEAEGFEVTAATSAEAALRRLPGLLPDVVVMGVNPPAVSVVEDIRLVLEAAPGTAVLMLAIVADDEQVLQAVKAGAAGYLLKDAELAQIVAGIPAVAAGHPRCPRTRPAC